MNKKVVYSAVFGKNDQFPYLAVFNESIDYILFTSENIKPPDPWKVVKVEREFIDDSKNSRIYKLLPHLFLSEYDYSIWLDANLKIDIDMEYWFGDNTVFTCYRHIEGVPTYQEEIKRCILKKKEKESKLIKQRIAYEKDVEFVNRFNSILMAGFIKRYHNHKVIREFDCEWFSHVATMGKRDQPSLAYLRNKYVGRLWIDELKGFKDKIKIIGHRKRKD